MANSALKEAGNATEGVDFNHQHAARDVQLVDAHRGLVFGQRKKIAICGFASSSRHLMPVNDDTWEIWGLNQLYRHIPRADRWFDIHRNWDEEVVPGTDHHGWIRDAKVPVYMMERHPEFPMSVRYPVERLIEKFGVDYFTSTIAFMTALALDEIDQRVEAQLNEELAARKGGAVEKNGLGSWFVKRLRECYEEYTVGLFGIDLVVGEEYFYQKPCAEFWLGAAAVGRGIKVFLPPQSALCKQLYRYGYEAEPQSLIKQSELASHAGKIREERDQLLRQLYMRDGALQADEYWQQLADLRARGAEIQG